MPTKTQLITIGMTLVVFAAINNVDFLKPVKNVIEG